MAQTPEPILHECERLRLRAMRLPCGEQYPCFFPDVCPFVPVGATLAKMEKMESANRTKSLGAYGSRTESHLHFVSKVALAERRSATGLLARGRQFKRPKD